MRLCRIRTTVTSPASSRLNTTKCDLTLGFEISRFHIDRPLIRMPMPNPRRPPEWHGCRLLPAPGSTALLCNPRSRQHPPGLPRKDVAAHCGSDAGARLLAMNASKSKAVAGPDSSPAWIAAWRA